MASMKPTYLSVKNISTLRVGCVTRVQGTTSATSNRSVHC